MLDPHLSFLKSIPKFFLLNSSCMCQELPKSYSVFQNLPLRIMFSLNSFLNVVISNDQATNQVLVAGRLRDGLYAFDPPQFLTNTPSSTTSNARSDICLIQSFVDSVEQPCYIASKPYASSNNSPSQHCSNSSSTFTLWHNRLGHPSSSIVRTVLTNCNVPNSDKMITTFCKAVVLGRFTDHLLLQP